MAWSSEWSPPVAAEPCETLPQVFPPSVDIHKKWLRWWESEQRRDDDEGPEAEPTRHSIILRTVFFAA
jgi:hypothetical protein